MKNLAALISKFKSKYTVELDKYLHNFPLFLTRLIDMESMLSLFVGEYPDFWRQILDTTNFGQHFATAYKLTISTFSFLK